LLRFVHLYLPRFALVCCAFALRIVRSAVAPHAYARFYTCRATAARLPGLRLRSATAVWIGSARCRSRILVDGYPVTCVLRSTAFYGPATCLHYTTRLPHGLHGYCIPPTTGFCRMLLPCPRTHTHADHAFTYACRLRFGSPGSWTYVCAVAVFRPPPAARLDQLRLHRCGLRCRSRWLRSAFTTTHGYTFTHALPFMLFATRSFCVRVRTVPRRLRGYAFYAVAAPAVTHSWLPHYLPRLRIVAFTPVGSACRSFAYRSPARSPRRCRVLDYLAVRVWVCVLLRCCFADFCRCAFRTHCSTIRTHVHTVQSFYAATAATPRSFVLLRGLDCTRSPRARSALRSVARIVALPATLRNTCLRLRFVFVCYVCRCLDPFITPYLRTPVSFCVFLHVRVARHVLPARLPHTRALPFVVAVTRSALLPLIAWVPGSLRLTPFAFTFALRYVCVLTTRLPPIVGVAGAVLPRLLPFAARFALRWVLPLHVRAPFGIHVALPGSCGAFALLPRTRTLPVTRTFTFACDFARCLRTYVLPRTRTLRSIACVVARVAIDFTAFTRCRFCHAIDRYVARILLLRCTVAVAVCDEFRYVRHIATHRVPAATHIRSLRRTACTRAIGLPYACRFCTRFACRLPLPSTHCARVCAPRTPVPRSILDLQGSCLRTRGCARVRGLQRMTVAPRATRALPSPALRARVCGAVLRCRTRAHLPDRVPWTCGGGLPCRRHRHTRCTRCALPLCLDRIGSACHYTVCCTHYAAPRARGFSYALHYMPLRRLPIGYATRAGTHCCGLRIALPLPAHTAYVRCLTDCRRCTPRRRACAARWIVRLRRIVRALPRCCALDRLDCAMLGRTAFRRSDPALRVTHGCRFAFCTLYRAARAAAPGSRSAFGSCTCAGLGGSCWTPVSRCCLPTFPRSVAARHLVCIFTVDRCLFVLDRSHCAISTISAALPVTCWIACLLDRCVTLVALRLPPLHRLRAPFVCRVRRFALRFVAPLPRRAVMPDFYVAPFCHALHADRLPFVTAAVCSHRSRCVTPHTGYRYGCRTVAHVTRLRLRTFNVVLSAHARSCGLHLRVGYWIVHTRTYHLRHTRVTTPAPRCGRSVRCRVCYYTTLRVAILRAYGSLPFVYHTRSISPRIYVLRYCTLPYCPLTRVALYTLLPLQIFVTARSFLVDCTFTRYLLRSAFLRCHCCTFVTLDVTFYTDCLRLRYLRCDCVSLPILHTHCVPVVLVVCHCRLRFVVPPHFVHLRLFVCVIRTALRLRIVNYRCCVFAAYHPHGCRWHSTLFYTLHVCVVVATFPVTHRRYFCHV